MSLKVTIAIPNLAKKLYRLRNDCGLTREQLGKKIKLRPQTIYTIESGHRGLTMPVFRRYCDYFRIDPKSFIFPSDGDELEYFK